MNLYEVTVWPEANRKPYTERVAAPTSIDALNRTLAPWEPYGVSAAHVRLVTMEEQQANRAANDWQCMTCIARYLHPTAPCAPPADGSRCPNWRMA